MEKSLVKFIVFIFASALTYIVLYFFLSFIIVLFFYGDFLPAEINLLVEAFTLLIAVLAGRWAVGKTSGSLKK